MPTNRRVGLSLESESFRLIVNLGMTGPAERRPVAG
jgi:hypothetical protein